jgi:hypothetical protein
MSHPHECHDEPKLTAEEWAAIEALAKTEEEDN